MLGLAGLILFVGVRDGHGVQVPVDTELVKKHLVDHSGSVLLGDVFRAFKDEPRLKKVGIAGIGNGSMASFSRPGQEWTFYDYSEIVKIAEDPKHFTFLQKAKAKIKIDAGEPRMQLQESKAKYGLLVLDVFDDSVPVHMMTKQAFLLFRDRLEENGVLLVNVSIKWLDIEPVFANVAAYSKCVAYTRVYEPNDAEKEKGAVQSRWMAIAKQKEHLAPLLASESWRPSRREPNLKLWTDDQSSVLELLKTTRKSQHD